eukprot:TRINITY_DN67397_c3_g3_i1.p1 TRINITY_DN67397_c3_g3~~TRINITY_DN67397_c3_g3_i1.p1  ORF type:complete len:174 (+),score=2.35 TRINITY_DN67397_c3_g3_i1:314-835(+)
MCVPFTFMKLTVWLQRLVCSSGARLKKQLEPSRWSTATNTEATASHWLAQKQTEQHLNGAAGCCVGVWELCFKPPLLYQHWITSEFNSMLGTTSWYNFCCCSALRYGALRATAGYFLAHASSSAPSHMLKQDKRLIIREFTLQLLMKIFSHQIMSPAIPIHSRLEHSYIACKL